MLRENPEAAEALRTPRYRGRWVAPRYDSFCYSRIPKTLQSLLTGQTLQGALPESCFSNALGNTRNVLLLFLDAFGRHMVDSALSLPDVRRFFSRMEEQGIVSPITSQFPSTTAAHITTIHSGAPVAQTGVYEWFYYEAELDMVIAPLLSAQVGSVESRPLSMAGIHPARYLPQETLFPQLLSSGIHSHLFIPEAYCNSPYNSWVGRGAQPHPYRTLPDALSVARELLSDTKQAKYVFLYCDTFDSLCHTYGPDSAPVVAAAGEFFSAVENSIFASGSSALKNTTVLFTADHGQVSIDPALRHDLDSEIPNFASRLVHTVGGDPIVPAGSPRDFFLHVKPELLEDTEGLLRRHLAGVADVVSTSELLRDGIFGPLPHSPRFLRNLGNLVILPHEKQSVYWAGPDGRFTSDYRGHHGGMTAQEMESLFCCLSL